MGQPLLSRADAAAELAICERTLRRLVDKGKIKVVIVGRRWKVAAEEVERVKREGTDPCPFTGDNRKGRIGTNSLLREYDFAAARARRTGKKRSG